MTPSSFSRRTALSYCSAVKDGGAKRISVLKESLLLGANQHSPITSWGRLRPPSTWKGSDESLLHLQGRLRIRLRLRQASDRQARLHLHRGLGDEPAP